MPSKMNINKTWLITIILSILILSSIILCILFLRSDSDQDNSIFDPVWTYECESGSCQKTRVLPANKDAAISLSACRIFCSKCASIWPKPTKSIEFKKTLLQLDLNNIDISPMASDLPIKPLIHAAAKRFMQNIDSIAPKEGRKSGGRRLLVTLEIKDKNSIKLTMDTNEAYTLNINENSDGRINAVISGDNFFAARHGLETLSQVIIYDDLRGEFKMLNSLHIEDGPVYPHRGIILDSSRNYLSVNTIKNTIEGMAASKLNVFHWHITDSQSFPYVSKSEPQLSKLGAYSPQKIYSREDVADLVKYGRERGVKIMPEFDAPAHVGEGWTDTDFLACFNKQPWNLYCYEPPCGQLDPTKDGMYDVLENIYKDMIEQFDPDVFHMGGDEVNLHCWNSTESIATWMTSNGYNLTKEDYMKLWEKFQSEAFIRFTKHRGAKIPIIIWTSDLTGKNNLEYLSKDTYIIQIWTNSTDPSIQRILENGYRAILSNHDALYLDCGVAGWVTAGNNWCSPYIGWQKIYENSPAKIAGNYSHLMLGAEAALWSEQTDDSSVDSRLWPRAAAMAERLWAEPTTSWKDAESRMLIHRERLVNMKISADTLEPEWCLQNQNNCPIDSTKFVHTEL